VTGNFQNRFRVVGVLGFFVPDCSVLQAYVFRTSLDILSRTVIRYLNGEEEDDPRVGGLWRNAPR
jgi:hypothetical protein